jgi:ABC-type dipeptide/oligopeptide/nickel transport system ATPase subunit
MVENSHQIEDKFLNADESWDTSKLFSDLAKFKGKELSNNEKKFLRGVLCGNSPSEIAKKCDYRSKDPSVTVRQTLSKVYGYIENLLELQERIEWSKLPNLLQKYRKENQSKNLDVEHNNQIYTINWRELCKQSLEHYRKQNTFTNINNPIDFVPLGLFEVKKDDDNKINPTYEKTFTFQQPQEFFEQVFVRGEKSPKSQGKKLAIIGESGSGKTTLLFKIGFWLLEKTEQIPIWIDLTKFNQSQKELFNYIKEDWLKEVTGKSDIQDLITDLENNLKEGDFCLLLDGAEKIGGLREITSHLNPASLGKSRVIVSCRINYWNMDQSALSDFDIYKTLPLKLDQVQDFIKNLFGNNAQLLLNDLEQSKYSRLRDLITNLLYLNFLCQTWQPKKGLKDYTKAELIRLFLDKEFDLKIKDYQEINKPKKRDFFHALGRLAKKLIEIGDDSSSYNLVRQELGESDESFHKLAIYFNWLYCEKGNYKFAHDSIKEYFAALAIEDWDFFLPRNHIDHPVEDKRYLIFEKEWEEVILFWVGVNYLNQKENAINKFIQNLLNFQDGTIINFYGYHSYFLAISIILEIKENCFYDNVIQLIENITPKTSDQYIRFLFEESQKYISQINNIELINLFLTFCENNHEKLIKYIDCGITNFNNLNAIGNLIINKIKNNKLLFSDKNIIRTISIFLNKIYIYSENNNFYSDKQREYIYYLITFILSNVELSILTFENYCKTQKKQEYFQYVNKYKSFKNFIFNKKKYPNEFSRLYEFYTESYKILSQLLSSENKQKLFIKYYEAINSVYHTIEHCYAIENKIIIYENLCIVNNNYYNIVSNQLFLILKTYINDGYLFYLTSDTLIKIANKFNDELIIINLLKIIKSNTSLLKEINLQKIKLKSINIINFMLDLLEMSKTDDQKISIINFLIQTQEKNQNIINSLNYIIENNSNNYYILVHALRGICSLENTEIPKTIKQLEFILDKIEKIDNYLWLYAINILTEINNQKLKYVEILIDKIQHITKNYNEYNIGLTISILIDIITKIDPNNKQAIRILLELYVHDKVKYSDIINHFNSLISTNLECIIEIINNYFIDKETFFYKILDLLELFTDRFNNNFFVETKNIIVEKLETEIYRSKKYDEKHKIAKVLIQLDTSNKLALNTLRNVAPKEEILWQISKLITYPEFYKAWHSNNQNIHPEVKEITPVGKDEITNKLNQQITDIYSNLKTNLKANDKTYPIVINLSSLAQTIDIQTISNEICYQIYQTALPNAEIPEVNNSNQLKRLIKNVVEKILNVEQIVLILIGDPYPELETFCQQMINSVYLGWVTNQTLNPSLLNNNHFRSFAPDQANLTNIIQNWIDGIS